MRLLGKTKQMLKFAHTETPVTEHGQVCVFRHFCFGIHGVETQLAGFVCEFDFKFVLPHLIWTTKRRSGQGLPEGLDGGVRTRRVLTMTLVLG